MNTRRKARSPLKGAGKKASKTTKGVAAPPAPAAPAKERIFKGNWFNREAAGAGIPNKDLRDAVDELKKGQGDDLGGNVWKKRLSNNTQRSIVVTRKGQHWIFVYLFGKQDRDNIKPQELAGFKKLAKDYAKLDEAGLDAAVEAKKLTEV